MHNRILTALGALALVMTANANAAARLLVGHFAPFADTVEGTSVSVLVNGAEALSDFRFGETEGYLELPAGDYLVEIVPTGTQTVAISANVTLEDGVDYTALAIGDGVKQPLEILALVDDNTAPAAGNVRVRIIHAAPFADELDTTEVSIRTAVGELVAGLTGVPFRGVSPYLELPSAIYDLKVASPDGRKNFIDPKPVDLPAGAVLTVIAVGDGENQPLGIVVPGLGALPLRTPVDFSYNASWFNAAFPGQGFSFEVIPLRNRLVIYWFAFDALGNLIWFTGDGLIDDNVVELTIYQTTGGVFLAPSEIETTPVGTATVTFNGCFGATFDFTLDLPDKTFAPAGLKLKDSIELSRLSPDAVCVK